MSNYNFAPTLDGLNNVDGNSINSNTVITDYLTVNLGSSVPTLAPSTNNNSIASTAFVQSLISSVPTNYVTIDTTQTLTTGIKTFTNLPECSAVPTTRNQLCNKDYVDNGVFVNLNGAQIITGQKKFTDFNVFVNDNGINSNNGTLGFQDSSGNGALMYFNNDDSAGSGGLRVVSTSYGFAFSSTTGAGEHCDFLSQDINFRATDSCIFSELAIPPPTGGQKNQLKRGAIYNKSSTLINPTVTYTNGTQTDSGTIFTAMTITAPINNTCNSVSVKIAFDLIAWATFGLALGSGTVGLQFNSYTLSILKNSVAYTPSILNHFSNATGTQQNWTKSGNQTNIQGLGAYFGTIDAIFDIDINNATADVYQIRITPTMTITYSAFSFDGFKFACRNSTSGGTNGNSFFTGVITNYTGGTLTYASSVPTFVDSSITKIGLSYPVPTSSNYCFMPLNNNITPAGMISNFVSSTPPDGWLVCNGASISITTYGNLFSVIGFTYGGTLSSGNFTLPNFSGAFIRGAGSQVFGGITYGGNAVGTAQQDQVMSAEYSTNQGYYNLASGGTGKQCIARFRITGPPADPVETCGVLAQFTRQGAETRPFNHSLYYIIKY